MSSEREKRIQAYVDTHGKSVLGGFFLALLLGPLALFYVSISAGLIAVLLLLALALIVPSAVGFFGLIFWVISLFLVPYGAIDHNRKQRAAAELMAGG